MGVTLEQLWQETRTVLALDLIAGRGGLHRTITGSRIQKPSLALAGHTAYVNPQRLQLLGLTEVSYLQTLPAEACARSIEVLCNLEPSAIVVTRGLSAPPQLLAGADVHNIPLFSTPLPSSVFTTRITSWLDHLLAPSTTLHGVLIDVFGVGILLQGKSGIGKSEAALDLVLRGHRFVADDVVEIRRRSPDLIYGSGASLLKYHLEIRGLGIINVKDLFGISAIRETKKIEQVVELVDWDEAEEYDRMGIEELRHVVMDVAIPMVRVPIRPGRNITSIIEVAARNQLLKMQGKHSAREFQDKILRALETAKQTTPPEEASLPPTPLDEVE